jgi:hypothetical protein
MAALTLLDVFDELVQTREGRKTLTFALRYGTTGNPDADGEIARRAWEWVDDPTKESHD